MPDPNKMKVLESFHYKIGACCGLCQYARFAVNNRDWGVCAIHSYEHAKHGRRKLSIHRAGCCSEFSANEINLADLECSGFDRFEDGQLSLDRLNRKST